MLKSFLIFIIFLPVGLTALSQDKDTSNVVILLQDVSIKTNRPKIVYKGDTIVFNAEAYKTSQGAMLENLIRKLPGIVIDPNGNITYNGKNVREIKVNGKDFFKGNNDIAIKNLPVDIVKEIKVYEEESRQAKHSGIPETEKNQILDVTLKEDLKKTLTFDGHTNMANHKHSDNGLFAQEFTDKWSASIYGNMMNLPQNLDFDNTYGLTASKEIGGMVQWSNKEGEDVSGQINLYATSYYGYTDNDVRSTSINETYLNSGNEQSYTHSMTSSRSKNHGWNNFLDFSWVPDSNNFINVNISISTDRNHNWSEEKSVMFNSDPYLLMANPLEEIFYTVPNKQIENIMVNTNQNATMGHGKGESYNISTFLAHHFDTLGTSLSARLEYDCSHNSLNNFAINHIKYYQQGTELLPTFYDQYVSTPNSPYSFNSMLDFSYHFTKTSAIYGSYSFRQSYSNEDRSWYELDSLQQINAYNYPALGWLPESDSLLMAKILSNCQYTTYHRNTHTMQVGAHLKLGKWTIRPYINFLTKHTKLNFTKSTFSTAVKKNHFFVEPGLYSEHKFSDQQYLRFSYYTHTTSPDLLNYIDIEDESNPLYITRGNPELKDAWSHSANLWYQNYNRKRQENIIIHPSFSQSFNQITQKLTYDKSTGKTIAQATNINGNLDASLNIDYNKTLGKENAFTIAASSMNGYTRNVGFISTTDSYSDRDKNIMNNYHFEELVSGTYRTDKTEVILSANTIYNHSRSNNGLYNRLNTTVTTIKCNWQYELPWKMEVSTDFGVRMRRGYTDDAMNTTEWLWNAKISQSFLKKKNLIVGLRYNDILHQRQYVSRSINATSKYETKTNHVGSFLMLMLQYKFSSKRTG